MKNLGSAATAHASNCRLRRSPNYKYKAGDGVGDNYRVSLVTVAWPLTHFQVTCAPDQ